MAKTAGAIRGPEAEPAVALAEREAGDHVALDAVDHGERGGQEKCGLKDLEEQF